MATLAFGALGVLASQELPWLASYCVLVSSGTLLAAIAIDNPALTGAALYYLIVSTLGLSAFFLLVELVERGRGPGADMLAVTAEAFGAEAGDEDDEEDVLVGAVIPAANALLGLSFAACAIMLAGLPPLAGFVGKFAMLDALFARNPVPATSWTMLALLIASGFATVIGMGRAGMRRFWASPAASVPRVRVVEIAPIVALLALCAALTVQPGASMRYLSEAARALYAPADYVDRVLRAR
jgi:multicomponent K+:H+ antiporter subunit D